MWKKHIASIRATRLIDALFSDVFVIFSDTNKSDAQKLVDIRNALNKAFRFRRYLDCGDGINLQAIFLLIKFAWDVYSLITNCRNNYAYRWSPKAIYASH